MSGERGNKNRRTDERQNERPQGRSVEIVRHRLCIQSCPENSTRWKTGAVDMWPAAAAASAFSIQFPQRFAMESRLPLHLPIRLLQFGSFRDLKPTQFTVARGKAIDRAREKVVASAP
jgi:hypothetical protein